LSVDRVPRGDYNEGVLRSLTLPIGLGLPSRRPAPAWILLFGLLAAALLAAPLALPHTPPRVSSGPPAAPDEPSALAAARAVGQPVEALSDRTEFSQTFANPSGTLTLNESVTPVRARRPDGAWVPVDNTLQTLPDGTVAPVASVVDVAFSGGGSGPLVRIARGGDRITLGWPAALPAPTLSGATATYGDVLPGVDLQLTARPLGFSQLLVVKSAEAARNPALLTVRFAVASGGVTLRATADGGLTAVDGVDREVFSAPPASMWDASGGSRARVGVRVGADLDLLPDVRMLTGATTQFPVTVDPDLYWVPTTGVQQAWTKVDACFPDQTYWLGAHDPDSNPPFGQVKVGRAPSDSAVTCADGSFQAVTYRSLFQLDTSRVSDKIIHKATFNVFETYAPACDAEPVDLWWTGRISSSTDWNQMTWIKRLDSWSGAHGYPPGTCSARSWVTFSADDVTAMVAQIAAGDSPNLTLGLRAPDESPCHSDSTGNTCQWKKFDSGAISDSDTPFLSIEYNTPPNASADLFTDAGSPYLYPNGRIPCDSNANYINTTTPRMHATISDPDDTGSSQPQPLNATYVWSVGAATDTARDPVTGPGRTPGDGNTSVATSASIPAGELGNGNSVLWHVVANDNLTNGPASATCHLTIDTTDISQRLPGVTSTDGRYPPGGASPPTSVGTPGAFTFDPAGTTDVAGYLYGLNTSTPWKFVHASGTGNTATVTIDPPVVGDNSLVVRIIGLGGNLGKVQTYDVITGHGTTGSVLLAHYGMDEGSGSAVADSTGGHEAVAAGSFAWTTGRTGASTDHALDLTSSPGGYAEALDSTVDTRYGFTVSAWVRLDDTNGIYHILSQDGASGGAGYYLESFPGTAPRWAFSMPTSDGPGPQILHAFSDSAPRVGVWTHLVGVFCADPSCLAPGDTEPGRLYLYVDGTLQTTQPVVTTPWRATGATQIGRGQFGGSSTAHKYIQYLNGAVDDVSVYWGDPCPQPKAPTTPPTPSTCSIP
jgi:hypothetical protein